MAFSVVAGEHAPQAKLHGTSWGETVFFFFAGQP